MDKSYLEMMWADIVKPAKPSKRSQGRAVKCARCHATRVTLYRQGDKYLCRKCKEKENRK